MNYKTLCAGLLKYAALKDTLELKDYQERAVKKIQDMGSLIVAHGTGTGKTVTSIAAAEKLKEQGKVDKVIVKELIAVEPDEPPILGFIKRKKTPSVEEWMKSVSDKKKNLQKQVYEYFGR